MLPKVPWAWLRARRWQNVKHFKSWWLGHKVEVRLRFALGTRVFLVSCRISHRTWPFQANAGVVPRTCTRLIFMGWCVNKSSKTSEKEEEEEIRCSITQTSPAELRFMGGTVQHCQVPSAIQQNLQNQKNSSLRKLTSLISASSVHRFKQLWTVVHPDARH